MEKKAKLFYEAPFLAVFKVQTARIICNSDDVLGQRGNYEIITENPFGDLFI